MHVWEGEGREQVSLSTKRMHVKWLPHCVPLYCYREIKTVHVYTENGGREEDRVKESVTEGGSMDIVLGVRVHRSKVDNHTSHIQPVST